MIDSVLKEFGLFSPEVKISSLHQGLINSTWKVSNEKGAFVIQKINTHVFKSPEDIASNVEMVSAYLNKMHPEYLFVSPLKTDSGETLVKRSESEYFRAFPFVMGSHTISVVSNPDEAYEAARQFGLFTRLLKGIDVRKLKITIPSFHDLSLRHTLFNEAVKNGDADRIRKSASVIEYLNSCSHINAKFKCIREDPAFKLRVTHHDTKISNVLFDDNNKGLCVIDLDTIMPGYFISDVGDMMRTYLCPVSEEETDLSKIEIRDNYYEALVSGYYDEMKDELTSIEKEHFFYAGTFMIYMQALRFLTDYLNRDVYYGARYPEHNLERAKNQAKLLSCLQQEKSVLEKV